MAQMNMQQMMKQARKMQEQLAAAQEKLKDLEVSSSTGGGMVKVVATGEMQIKSIEISPDACDPEDVELLQDMVLAAVNETVSGEISIFWIGAQNFVGNCCAVNEALSSAQEAAGSQMSAATGLGGMNIPGLF